MKRAIKYACIFMLPFGAIVVGILVGKKLYDKFIREVDDAAETDPT
jgi:hypothetical protein